MCYFKGNLARELARVHDWHGTLWQKRYSSEEILDEAGLIEVFKYITQNSVKEGLVDHPKDWTGLHGYRIPLGFCQHGFATHSQVTSQAPFEPQVSLLGSYL